MLGKTSAYLLVLVVVAAAMLIAACGSPEATATPQPTATQPPATQGPVATQAPGATQAPSRPTPTSAPAWEAEWERTVAEAKEEGQVVVTTHSIANRESIDKLAGLLPEGLRLEVQILSYPNGLVRIAEEYKAGIHNYDVYMSGFSTGIETHIDNHFGNTKAALNPELLDNDTWIGDSDDRWLDDKTKERYFNFGGSLSNGVTIWVNRAALPAGVSFNSIDDLLNPAMKGKWCSQDPRVGGSGIAFWVPALMSRGPEFVERLLKETSPIISRDQQQLGEMVIRGEVPVCVGANVAFFQERGVGLNVEEFVDKSVLDMRPEFRDRLVPTCCGNGKSKEKLDGVLSVGTAKLSAALMKEPPRPNAAKVFLNTLLSKEAQEAYWLPTDDLCSFRTDMRDWCAANKSDVGLPQEDGKYIHWWTPTNVWIQGEYQRIAREVLGR